MDFHAISNPLEEVDRFRTEAEHAGLVLPEAMTLATVSPDGRPHARVVLLKAREGRNFQFFTNYESDKAQDLKANPWAELCIHYPALALQARVSGTVQKVSAPVSDAYFATRPRDSQIGAWASSQSRPLSSRQALENEYSRWEKEYEGGAVPRPPHWGGYNVLAEQVELWVGRNGRLHDRARYCYVDETWQCRLLCP